MEDVTILSPPFLAEATEIVLSLLTTATIDPSTSSCMSKRWRLPEWIPPRPPPPPPQIARCPRNEWAARLAIHRIGRSRCSIGRAAALLSDDFEEEVGECVESGGKPGFELGPSRPRLSEVTLS